MGKGNAVSSTNTLSIKRRVTSQKVVEIGYVGFEPLTPDESEHVEKFRAFLCKNFHGVLLFKILESNLKDFEKGEKAKFNKFIDWNATNMSAFFLKPYALPNLWTSLTVSYINKMGFNI